MFILEGFFGSSKNYSKTYRGVADVRKAGSYSLFVQQLDREPVKPWSVQQRMETQMGKSTGAVTAHGGQWKS